MYRAVEWYFPKYGQTFNRTQYLNICVHSYVGYRARFQRCGSLTLASRAHVTKVQAHALSCAAALTLVRKSGATRVQTGGRFIRGEFLCGTEGVRLTLNRSVYYECDYGPKAVIWQLSR